MVATYEETQVSTIRTGQPGCERAPAVHSPCPVVGRRGRVACPRGSQRFAWSWSRSRETPCSRIGSSNGQARAGDLRCALGERSRTSGRAGENLYDDALARGVRRSDGLSVVLLARSDAVGLKDPVESHAVTGAQDGLFDTVDASPRVVRPRSDRLQARDDAGAFPGDSRRGLRPARGRCRCTGRGSMRAP